MRDGDLLVERVLLLARMRAVAAAVSAVLVGKAGWAGRMGVCWLVVERFPLTHGASGVRKGKMMMTMMMKARASLAGLAAGVLCWGLAAVPAWAEDDPLPTPTGPASGQVGPSSPSSPDLPGGGDLPTPTVPTTPVTPEQPSQPSSGGGESSQPSAPSTPSAPSAPSSGGSQTGGSSSSSTVRRSQSVRDDVTRRQPAPAAPRSSWSSSRLQAGSARRAWMGRGYANGRAYGAPAAAGGPRLAQTGVDASRATLVGLVLAGLAAGLLLVRRRMAAGRG